MATNKPFFVPQKEVDLFDALNEELIDEIIGQTVDIYKITIENTEENMYGESTTKYYDQGPDLNTSIEMYFHRTTLKEASFYPEIGDIVDWNGYYFEMNSVTEPQLVAGHQNFKHSIIVKAHRSRLSGLQIEERPR